MLRNKCRVIIIFVIVIVTLPAAVYGGDNWTHYENGLRFLKQGRYDAALNNFSYYLHQPEMHRRMFGVAYFGRGLLFQALGNNTKALQEFQKAIENDLHPTVKVTENAYMNIGTIMMKKEMYQDAVNAYTKAVESNPNNGFAHYYRGLAYFKVGDYERAEKASEEAKRLGVEFTALKDKLAEKKSDAKADQKRELNAIKDKWQNTETSR